MKRNDLLLRRLAALFFPLMLLSAAYGQGTATIDNNLVIQLDETAPLETQYELQVPEGLITNNSQFERYCQNLSDPSITFLPDLAHNRLKIQLNIKNPAKNQNWTAMEWNEHLVKKARRTRFSMDF